MHTYTNVPRFTRNSFHDFLVTREYRKLIESKFSKVCKLLVTNNIHLFASIIKISDKPQKKQQKRNINKCLIQRTCLSVNIVFVHFVSEYRAYDTEKEIEYHVTGTVATRQDIRHFLGYLSFSA